MQDIFTMSEVLKNENVIRKAQDFRGLKTLENSGMFKRLGTNRLLNFTD